MDDSSPSLRALRGVPAAAGLAGRRQNPPLSAYFAADRQVRLAGETAGNLIARAEAAHRLGRRDDVVADLRRGWAHDPFNRALGLRLAEWGEAAELIEAARLLTDLSPRDAEIGLRILLASGETAAGALRFEDGFAIGWLAWRPEFHAELQFEAESPATRRLAPAPGHPLATVFGASLHFRCPCSAQGLRRITLAVDGRAIATARGPSPIGPEDAIVGAAAASTILIPVYDDYEATRDCLETVAAEVEASADLAALAIDDGSPDPEIRATLTAFARRPRWRVVANPGNLGFVATVNRGLRLIGRGDVLLLNADTLLAPGALTRLARAARANADVGIVNPLSNHGEFTSFPRPFRRNAFDAGGWREIDRAAAASGGTRVVDIPSATGFCMYLTRACLDAVGGLSEAFGEGYLEDADFGLRAREAGFRNVCALSVYVPHLGSRSFKSKKAGLVARNRVALARRFPDYEFECRAFLAADPLAKGRARLELALAATSPKRRLLLGPARWQAAMDERAEQLQAEGVDALLAVFETVGGAVLMTLRGTGDASPQNATVGPTREEDAVAEALNAWPCDRVEFFYAPDAPKLVATALSRDRRPRDLVLAAPPRDLIAWPACERVIAFDAMTARACESLGIAAQHARGAAPLGQGDGVELAVLHPFETASSRRFLAACARALSARGRTALLLGACSAEERLIAEGLLATGPVRREDWPRLLRLYAPRRYLAPYRGEGFWALEAARALAPAPAAFFDATRSGFRPGADDLPLDVDADDSAAAESLLDWAFPLGTQDRIGA